MAFLHPWVPWSLDLHELRFGNEKQHPCPRRWSHLAEVHGCSPSFCIAFWRSWVFPKTNVGKAWLRFCCSLARSDDDYLHLKLSGIVENSNLWWWEMRKFPGGWNIFKLGAEYEIMDLKISISQLWTNRRFISMQRAIPNESYELAVLWPRKIMQQSFWPKDILRKAGNEGLILSIECETKGPRFPQYRLGTVVSTPFKTLRNRKCIDWDENTQEFYRENHLSQTFFYVDPSGWVLV